MTEQSKDDKIKQAYIERLGSDEGWLHKEGSYFIEGFLAAERAQHNHKVEAEVQRRVAEKGKNIAATIKIDSANQYSITYINYDVLGTKRYYGKLSPTEHFNLYVAPPQAQLQAAIDQARNEVGLAIQSQIPKESNGIGEAGYKSGMRDACGIALDQIDKPLGDSHDNG